MTSGTVSPKHFRPVNMLDPTSYVALATLFRALSLTLRPRSLTRLAYKSQKDLCSSEVLNSQAVAPAEGVQ